MNKKGEGLFGLFGGPNNSGIAQTKAEKEEAKRQEKAAKLEALQAELTDLSQQETSLISEQATLDTEIDKMEQGWGKQTAIAKRDSLSRQIVSIQKKINGKIGEISKYR